MSDAQPANPEQPATPAAPERRPTARGAAPRLAVWEYAGLMVTYWCNARCAFCYVYSAPDRGGDLQPADAVRIWAGLDRLAASNGRTMRIHLAGGEPFGDWPRLLGTVRAAREAGLSPLEKIETNGYWATDDALTLSRLEQLDALGIDELVISADVYHQAFIPPENVERLVRIAREQLGRRRVRVRWWDARKRPIDLRRASADARTHAYEWALRRHKDRITGRAAGWLSSLLPRRPAEAFAGENCTKELLDSRHVHVDPYGNVFPGVCSGIILGNALREDVPAMWQRLAAEWREHPVVGPCASGGSHALMRRASEFGYRERADGYANKCHLCTDVRQFLVERDIWPESVGPRECYANATDRRAEARHMTTRPRRQTTTPLRIRGRVAPEAPGGPADRSNADRRDDATATTGDRNPASASGG